MDMHGYHDLTTIDLKLLILSPNGLNPTKARRIHGIEEQFGQLDYNEKYRI